MREAIGIAIFLVPSAIFLLWQYKAQIMLPPAERRIRNLKPLSKDDWNVTR